MSWRPRGGHRAAPKVRSTDWRADRAADRQQVRSTDWRANYEVRSGYWPAELVMRERRLPQLWRDKGDEKRGGVGRCVIRGPRGAPCELWASRRWGVPRCSASRIPSARQRLVARRFSSAVENINRQDESCNFPARTLMAHKKATISWRDPAVLVHLLRGVVNGISRSG